MTYRTTCEEHNAAGYAEATYDECEEEECCDDCQDHFAEQGAQFDWEDAQTARAEGGYGYSGGWSGHERAWYDG